MVCMLLVHGVLKCLVQPGTNRPFTPTPRVSLWMYSLMLPPAREPLYFGSNLASCPVYVSRPQVEQATMSTPSGGTQSCTARDYYVLLNDLFMSVLN